MTDQEKPKKKQLTLSKKLDLKDLSGPKAEPSKGKTVVVEVKKSARGASRPAAADAARGNSRLRGLQLKATGAKATTGAKEPKKPVLADVAEADASQGLTRDERQVRIDALRGALANADIEQQRELERLEREQEAARQLQLKKEQAAQEALAAEQAAEAERLEAAKLELAEQMQAPVLSDKTPEKKAPRVHEKRATDEGESSRKSAQKTRKEEAPHKVISHRDAPRRTGKLTVSQALGDGEGAGRTRSLASIKRAREKERKKQLEADQPQTKMVRTVVVPEAITVQELSNRMAERSSDVIKALMKMGMMVTITQSIDGDTAELIVEEMGHKVQRVSEEDIENEFLAEMLEAVDDVPLESRPPVVTVMGHVDHGKTSLLDALRKTDVVAGESGGITQHIGAYQVTLPSQKKITFIDTPGHAAFTQMRARGANVTDIVILLVAADDGVKDQTVEAINHAKSAGVPIIVAINKIDKPDANIDRVKSELLQHEIVLEDFGGDILSIAVSAKQRQNLEQLEETILLQSDMLDLKAPIDRPAVAAVVEARLEKGRGAVATVLVQQGTLKVGDIFVAGSQCGRVRAMTDDHGQRVEHAIPAMPVEITGFDAAPQAGDTLIVVKEESRAREIASFRERQRKNKEAALLDKKKKANLFSHVGKEEVKRLTIIIKSDAQGSSEAIAASLEKLSTEEIDVNIVHMGVGAISETDVILASASNAMIVGFHVRANTLARELAEKEGVEIRYYSIIYDIVDDVKAVASGLLSPIIQEKFIGKAEIREIFKISSVGTIAGCYVTEGVVKRGSKVRLLRDNVVIHEGALKTLKRFKDEVKEVKESYECGMAFENYNDLKVGDVIECAELEEIARSL